MDGEHSRFTGTQDLLQPPGTFHPANKTVAPEIKIEVFSRRIQSQRAIHIFAAHRNGEIGFMRGKIIVIQDNLTPGRRDFKLVNARPAFTDKCIHRPGARLPPSSA